MSAHVALQPPNMGLGTWYQSQAAEEVKQVATGRYVLNGLYVVNVSASTRYVWVFDNTASSGTVLCGPFPLATGAYISLHLPFGMKADTGIRVAASSTLATFTASAANDLMMTVGYSVNTARTSPTT